MVADRPMASESAAKEPAVAEWDVPIAEWQQRAAEWTDSRFPDDDLSQRGLVLGEETGEVLRCILKAQQNIRGGSEFWMGELSGEAADVFFCLVALAHRAGFSLSDAISARWQDLKDREYVNG